MKENLMQKQLRNSQRKRGEIGKEREEEVSEIDLTSKAFYIARELYDSKYAFTKKSLANYLHNKPILVQQNSKQQPPSVLKGYMSLFDCNWTEEMIEVMIRVNILREEKVMLQKRSSTRLFATTKYDWKQFPKVTIKVNSRVRSEQSIINRQNQGNSQLPNNRFTIFIKQKKDLPVNEEKRQEDLRIKAEREKQQQQERKRLKEQEQKRMRQKQREQQQRIQHEEKQRAKKEEQKKRVQSQMNDCWKKQREKIEQFICPKTDFSLVQSPNFRKSKQQRQQVKENAAIQVADNVLQIQMKELKEKEDQRKNPIKSIISWSFMKSNIDDDQSLPSQKFRKSPNRKQKNNLEQQKLANYQSHLKVEEKPQCHDSFSDSTEVTQTNYKLRSRQKKQKVKNQQQHSPEPQQKPIGVFARTPELSMFSSNYLSNKTILQDFPSINVNKRASSKNCNKQQKQNDFFSFKRERPEGSDEEESEETVTIAKKPASRVSSFEELDRVLKKSQIQQKKYKSKQRHFFPIQSQNDQEQFSSHFSPIQYSQTRTIARPCPFTQQPLPSNQSTQNMHFHQQSQDVEIDLPSETITVTEPIHKNQRTSTKGLAKYSKTQPTIKRDSFAQELIDNYMRRK